jgi:hypothetical protein
MSTMDITILIVMMNVTAFVTLTFSKETTWMSVPVAFGILLAQEYIFAFYCNGKGSLTLTLCQLLIRIRNGSPIMVNILD